MKNSFRYFHNTALFEKPLTKSKSPLKSITLNDQIKSSPFQSKLFSQISQREISPIQNSSKQIDEKIKYNDEILRLKKENSDFKEKEKKYLGRILMLENENNKLMDRLKFLEKEKNKIFEENQDLSKLLKEIERTELKDIEPNFKKNNFFLKIIDNLDEKLKEIENQALKFTHEKISTLPLNDKLSKKCKDLENQIFYLKKENLFISKINDFQIKSQKDNSIKPGILRVLEILNGD